MDKGYVHNFVNIKKNIEILKKSKFPNHFFFSFLPKALKHLFHRRKLFLSTHPPLLVRHSGYYRWKPLPSIVPFRFTFQVRPIPLHSLELPCCLARATGLHIFPCRWLIFRRVLQHVLVWVWIQTCQHQSLKLLQCSLPARVSHLGTLVLSKTSFYTTYA